MIDKEKQWYDQFWVWLTEHPKPTDEPVPPPPPPPAGKAFGINISGAEYRDKSTGGPRKDLWVGYQPRSQDELQFYADKGLRIFRLQFSWDQIQPSLYSQLDTDQVGWIWSVLEWSARHECKVILDPHNYARYRGNVIGTNAVPFRAFRDFWSRMAAIYRDHPGLFAYGLMNEPHDTGGLWTGGGAQAGIDGIREVDPDTLILVPGDEWTGAHSWGWSDVNKGFRITDPSNNFAIEAHQYFDACNCGQYSRSYSTEGGSPTLGVSRCKAWIDWLRERGYRGFLGEYGAPYNDLRWLPTLENFLQMIQTTDVLIGGTVWVGGPIAAWPNGYMELPVTDPNKPQWAVLSKYPTTL